MAELLPTNAKSGTGGRALTVAGQWRNFTAFPNILGDNSDVWLRTKRRCNVMKTAFMT